MPTGIRDRDGASLVRVGIPGNIAPHDSSGRDGLDIIPLAEPLRSGRSSEPFSMAARNRILVIERPAKPPRPLNRRKGSFGNLAGTFPATAMVPLGFGKENIVQKMARSQGHAIDGVAGGRWFTLFGGGL